MPPPVRASTSRGGDPRGARGSASRHEAADGAMKRLGPSTLVVTASVLLSCTAPGPPAQPASAAVQPIPSVTARHAGGAPAPPTEFTGTWCNGPEVAPDRVGTETTIEVG